MTNEEIDELRRMIEKVFTPYDGSPSTTRLVDRHKSLLLDALRDVERMNWMEETEAAPLHTTRAEVDAAIDDWRNDG